MIEYVVGDLFAGDESVIAHGCNTRGVMGAGIARAVQEYYWDDVFLPYAKACNGWEFVPGSAQRCVTENRVVYNLGTQDDPGPCAKYWWVLLSFANMFEQMHVHGETRVAVPRIGAGIGGLDWRMVESMIETANSERTGITVAVYTLPNEVHKFPS